MASEIQPPQSATGRVLCPFKSARASVFTRIRNSTEIGTLVSQVSAVTFYKRNLPHWHPKGAAIFLTWHLAGSRPKDIRKVTATLAAGTSELSAGKRFVILDREIDRAAVGPTWLRDPRVARCVVDTLVRGAIVLGHYQLHAYVVMANHVHVLITPSVP